jgi:hypothetical protein
MHIRVDESGAFDFHDPQRFAVAVIAAVIIPDHSWAAVTEFVDEKKREWDMPIELKGNAMGGTQLSEVAEFLQRERLRIVAAVTDSRIFSLEAQRRWRALQVEKFEAAVSVSRQVEIDPTTRDRVRRLQTRLPSERHVKPPNFLQYFVLMPYILSRSLSAGLVCFRTLPSDSWVFDIAVDPRDGADPGKAGKLLRDSVDAIFASDKKTTLLVPGEWPDDHPFKVKNADPEVGELSPRQILARGIQTPNSHEDPGLQIADVVAHSIFSAVRDGDDEAVAIWGRLQGLMMPTEDGRPVMVWGAHDEAATPADERRYLRLFERSI